MAEKRPVDRIEFRKTREHIAGKPAAIGKLGQRAHAGCGIGPPLGSLRCGILLDAGPAAGERLDQLGELLGGENPRTVDIEKLLDRDPHLQQAAFLGKEDELVVFGDVVEVAIPCDDFEEVVVWVELSPSLPEIRRPEGGTLGLLVEASDLRQGAFQNFDAGLASSDLFLKVLDEVFWAVVNFFEVDEADFEIGDPLLITCFRFTDLLLVRLDDVPVRTGSIDIESGQLVQQQSHDQGALGQGVVLRVIERQRGQGCGVDRAGQGLAAAQEFYRLQGICHLRRVLGGWRLAQAPHVAAFPALYLPKAA